VGSTLTFHTLRGPKGNIISHLPDGKVVLFDRSSPHLDALRSGQTVECRVVYVAPRYVIIEVIEDPGGQDDLPLRENIESPMEDPEMAVVARALLHIIDRLEERG